MKPSHVFFLLAAFGLGMAAFMQAQTPREPKPLGLGDQAITLDMTGLDGQPASTGDYPGKVLVLNFWATWCPPCKREIPVFMQAQTTYAARGVQVLGVAVDSVEAVSAFVREQPFNYPILTGQTEAMVYGARLGNLYGALPYTVIVDRDGRIAYLHAGELNADTLAVRLEGLL